MMSAPVTQSSFASYCLTKVRTNQSLFALYFAAISALIVVLLALQLDGSTNAMICGTFAGAHLIWFAVSATKDYLVMFLMQSLIADKKSKVSANDIDMSREHQDFRTIVKSGGRGAIYKCHADGNVAYLVPIQDEMQSFLNDENFYLLIKRNFLSFRVKRVNFTEECFTTQTMKDINSEDGIRRVLQGKNDLYTASIKHGVANSELKKRKNSVSSSCSF